MPKEVRLNDKMWFGRFKGKTIKWIVDNDMNFLEKLIDKGKISYHKNVVDYFEHGRFSKSKYWVPDPIVAPAYGVVAGDDDEPDDEPDRHDDQPDRGWGEVRGSIDPYTYNIDYTNTFHTVMDTSGSISTITADQTLHELLGNQPNPPLR